MQVCSTTAPVNPGEGVCSAWRGRRTDRSMTPIAYCFIYKYNNTPWEVMNYPPFLSANMKFHVF